MKYRYKLVFDFGDITYIVAKTRTEAIEKYHYLTGMPKDTIKKHCLITNEGEA